MLSFRYSVATQVTRSLYPIYATRELISSKRRETVGRCIFWLESFSLIHEKQTADDCIHEKQTAELSFD